MSSMSGIWEDSSKSHAILSLEICTQEVVLGGLMNEINSIFVSINIDKSSRFRNMLLSGHLFYLKRAIRHHRLGSLPRRILVLNAEKDLKSVKVSYTT